MSKDRAIDLLDKFLKGECSEEEQQRVMLWLDGLDNQSNQWSGLSEEEKRSYIETLYTDLLEKTTIRTQHKKPNSPRKLYWVVAASILIAATLGLLYTTAFQSKDTPVVEYATVTTGIGEVDTLTLSDGTEVWLNAMSELRYSSKYNFDNRIVYLKGEAFFKVTKEKDKPFVVHSGALNTKVLGTSFNVNAYPEDKDIEVTVLSGKVAVNDDAGENAVMILRQNEAVKYKKKQTDLIKYKVANGEDATAWQKKQLAFYHTPMTEVAKAFYRSFGIKIRFIDKEIQQYELSGHFDITQKPEDILKAICVSIGGQYTKQGKNFAIDDMKKGN